MAAIRGGANVADLADLADVVITDVQGDFKKEVDFAELLPEEHRRFGTLLRKLEADGDSTTLTLVVDLAVSAAEQYWWSENPTFAYDVCDRIVQQLARLRDRVKDSDAYTLESARLFIMKSRIERVWGGVLPRIEQVDEGQGQRLYAQLGRLEPTTEVAAYRLKRIMVEAQSGLLGSLTDASPLVDLIDSPPGVETARDRIFVGRDRAWAFVERSRVLPEKSDWLGEKALLLQYAVDYIDALPEEMTGAMNAADQRYFERLRRQAEEQLGQAKERALSLNVDIDDTLANRLPVSEYRVGGPH